MRFITCAFGLFVTVGAACTSFGSDAPPPVSEDATAPNPPTDAAALGSDAAPSDSGGPGCAGVPRGTLAPCESCVVEELVRLNPGQFAFSLVLDATHVYWIEQTDRDGKSAGKVMRMPVGGGAPSLVVDLPAAAPNKLALVGTDVYVASEREKDLPVVKVPKTCGGMCLPDPVGGTARVRCVADYGGQLAVATPNDVLVGVKRYGIISPFESALAPFGDDLAIVRVDPGGLGALAGRMVTTDKSFPLAPPVAAAWGASQGASRLAVDCSGLWALQHFEKQSALIHTRPAENGPSAVYPVGNTFALVADATHAYVGRPDAGGVFRASATEAPKLITAELDVWTLAVNDDYVYFDVHKSPDTRIARLRKSR